MYIEPKESKEIGWCDLKEISKMFSRLQFWEVVAKENMEENMQEKRF